MQKTLLINASPWFKEALTGTWTKTKRLILPFPEVGPDVIEQFLYYLFQGEARLPTHEYQSENLAIGLWVFADQHLLPKLQNQAMRHIYQYHNPVFATSEYLSTDTIAEALDTSAPDSALYKFMIWTIISGLCSVDGVGEETCSDYRMGQFWASDLITFDRIPGLMTEILRQFMMAAPMAKGCHKFMQCMDFLVEESKLWND